MQDKIKQQILSAFQLVFRPIVKIFLRYGISFSEFAETAKLAFVDVSSSEFGIRGRPTNISRVAVMTGLTRKEVRRLRNKLDNDDDGLEVKSTPISKVLSGWHSQQEFLEENGQPAALVFAGTENSFTELVKKFGGDVPPGAMRTELKRVGSVEEDPDGRLRVVRRRLVQDDKTDYLVSTLVHSVYALLSTVESSLDPGDSPFPQMTAHAVGIRKDDLPRLRRISKEIINSVWWVVV